MNSSEALIALRALADAHDPEVAHAKADDILLQLIEHDGDLISRTVIREAFDDVPKWYA